MADPGPPKDALVINATNNTSYSETLVNQKYAPLAGIDLASTGDKTLQALFAKRSGLLAHRNMFPTRLCLFASSWPKEDPSNGAMIVISSNRAEWIAQQLKGESTAARKYTGYCDADTYKHGLNLWYSPSRTAPDGQRRRPLYVVVSHLERAYYQDCLSPFKNVYVVGWQFDTMTPLAGFGASRFAALQMAKSFKYDKAWLVDDNVTQVNGFPNTLDDIEKLLTDDRWAIGFSGSTNCVTVKELAKEVNFKAQSFEIDKQESVLLQQVVLWNVKKLAAKHVDVHPCFIKSNEDVALCNYMTSAKADFRRIKPLAVVKLLPTKDTGNKGAAEVEKARSDLLDAMLANERDVWIREPMKKPVPLCDFVKNVVLPNSNYSNGPLKDACCQAVEQVLAAAAGSAQYVPKGFFMPFAAMEGTTVERRHI